MVARKSISKKIRFEIFKRDSFKCQYCGNSAPDVILHIDHIHPVSKGGDNDITNLITACFDCNMGKKHRLIDDNEVIAKQKAQLDILNEKRAQLEMLMKWRKDLISLDKKTLSIAVEFWHEKITGFQLNERGIDILKKQINKFGLQEVLLAMEIASSKFNSSTLPDEFSRSFDKIGAICQNKRQPEWKQQLSYIRGIAKNRHNYHNPYVLMKRLEAAYEAGVDTETLKEIALTSKHWSQMNKMIEEAVNAMVGNG